MRKLEELFRRAWAAPNIELDLVDYCNMSCINCVQGCNLRGASIVRGALTLEDIESLIRQFVDTGVRWNTIKIVGGEPTLHPQVIAITKMVRDYVRSHSPGTIIRFFSNGTTDFPAGEVRQYVDDYVTQTGIYAQKTKGQNYYSHHYDVYIRPEDVGMDFIDTTAGCDIPWNCGMGFTTSGFGVCCNVGNFLRIFGEESEMRTVLDLMDKDKWIAQALKYCRVCGIPLRIYQNKISRWWANTFKEKGIDYGDVLTVLEE